MFPINYWALIVSVIATLILGFLWYGPFFGKAWMKLVGLAPEQRPKPSSALVMIICTILMAYALKFNILAGSAYLNVHGVQAGLQAAFWNWLGFIATVITGIVLHERRSWKLWLINAGFYLVSLAIIGIILSVWV